MSHFVHLVAELGPVRRCAHHGKALRGQERGHERIHRRSSLAVLVKKRHTACRSALEKSVSITALFKIKEEGGCAKGCGAALLGIPAATLLSFR